MAFICSRNSKSETHVYLLSTVYADWPRTVKGCLQWPCLSHSLAVWISIKPPACVRLYATA